jgi:integrase
MICEAPDVSQLKGLRDRALLFTLATSGVRCEEVAKLLVEHVIEEERELTEEEWERYGHKPEKLADLQHGYVIKVIGKTDTGLRTAPLSPEAYTYIQAWLKARAGQVDSPYVFTSFTTRKFIPQNRHMGRNSVWDVVKRYAGQCGYPDITTHDFRRYVGTRLAKINPTTAKNALGHASVQTTIDHYDLNELELNITKNIL